MRIASTMTISSGLSLVPARGPIADDAQTCDPILSMRRAASIAGRSSLPPKTRREEVQFGVNDDDHQMISENTEDSKDAITGTAV